MDRRSRFAITGLLFLIAFLSTNLGFGQTTIFSENMGTPTGTTTLAAYITGTAPATFQNIATLTYSNGAQTNPGDLRTSSPSSTYTGFSAGGNVFLTTTSGAYGFSIESINASAYTGLSLQFGYRKESATLHATFSVDYWDGTAWQVLANTSAALFNEAAAATAGWYLSKALTLPAGAQISGLKIRFVKTGTASIRLDDVKLTGTAAATPTISQPSAITGLNYTGAGPSTWTSYTFTASNLSPASGNITVAGTTNFEVSSDGISAAAGNSYTVAYTGSALASTTTYVRLKAGLSAATYGPVTGVTLAGGGATTINVSTTGTVTAAGVATITPSGNISGLTYIAGSGPSTASSITLSASSLTAGGGNITITGSTNFEVSTTSSTTGFGASAIMPYTGTGTIASNTVWVRLKAGLSAATYAAETISISGGSASTSFTAAGTVTPAPSITPSGNITGLTYIQGSGPSTASSITLSAANLTAGGGNITITGSTNFEVSTTSSTTGFGASATMPYTGTGTIASNTIWVRLKAGLTAATYAAETINISGGSTTASFTAAGIVTAPAPVLTPTPASLTGLNYVLGSGPSTAQSFSLSGINLTGAPGNITISGSTNYNVSTDNISFGASKTVAYSSGTLSATTIYVQLKAGLSAGNYNSETISISGGGTTSSITASGTVAAPFTAGNLVVLRAGTGSAALAATGTPIFADEYNTSGTLTTSIPFPTSTSGSVNRGRIVGTSTAEGGLSLSSNGQYLIAPGYDAADAQATPNTATSRVISRMDKNGTVSSSLFGSTVHASNFRAVGSDDGSRYWTAGNASGIQYMAHQGSTTPGTPTAISSAPTANQRFTAVFNNQVYHTSQTALARTNVALPSATTTSTTIATLTDGYGFYFINRGGITWNLYVANGTNNTVLKFSSADDGANWTARGSISVGAAAYGLVAKDNAGNVDVYVSSPAALYKATDAAAYNANMTGTFASIATAPTNTAFRGLALSPNAAGILTSTGTINGFGYNGAGPSTGQSFNVSGSGLSANLVVTGSTNYEVSKDDISYGSSVSYAPSSGTVASSLVYVRLKAGLSTGNYNESVTVSSTGAYSKTVNVFGGVQPTVSLGVSSSTASESAGTIVTVTATTSPAVSGDQTLDLTVTGTGITAGDYILTDGDGTLAGVQVKILSGQTSGTVSFTVQNDGLNEGTEIATITGSNATSGMILVAPSSQTVTISDDDAELTLPAIGTATTTIDFDNLVSTGTSTELSKGGYLLETNGTGSAANSSYTTGSGTSTTGDSYSFGVAGTNPATDRTLGSLVTGGLSDVKQGFKIKNATGSAVNAVIVDYWGEQWRRGTTGSTGAQFRDKLLFQYSSNATDLSTGTWASSSRLNFNSPDYGNSALDIARDGNSSFYRTHVVDTFFLASSVANNANLWVRWQHTTTGTSGSRDGLGIDDVNFTAINYTPKIFYSAPSGDLNDLATWWTEADSSGINPSSFNGSNQTFIIQGRSAATIAANWTVSGSNSVVRVRTGVNFTIPEAFSFTGVIDSVASGATLTMLNAVVPSLNGIESGSLVVYGSSSNQTIAVPTSTNNQYGDLTINGAGVKKVQGGFRVTGNISLDNTNLDANTSFGVVFFQKNITATGTVSFTSNFNTYVNLQAYGSSNQVISGGGNTIKAGRLIMNVNNSGGTLITVAGNDYKTGSLSLAAGTPLTLGDDLKLNSNSGLATFSDNGNTITIGGDFECAGASTDYSFTGTVVLNSAVGANIRQDGSGGSGSSAKAELNNLTIETSATATVTVQPSAAPGTLIINGNLSIGGTSTGKLILGNNTLKVAGDYSNSRNADLVLPGTSTMEFNGTSAQSFSTAYTGGESFGSVVLNNSAGLNMNSGDMKVSGAGALTCTAGILNSGSGKIILSSTATISETTTSYVLGFVESTRTLTTALQSFGGMGLSITAAGAAPGVTTVNRETGSSLAIGCSSGSVKRNYTVTAATNSGLNATVVYTYSGTASELNGLNANHLNLFDQAGNLISANAVLNTGAKTITATGLNSLSSYVAAIPAPTLGGVTLSQVYTCDDSTNFVQLSGLLQSQTFNVNYSINGVPQSGIFGLVADASGNASFETQALNNANNGQLLEVVGIAQVSTGCSNTFTTGNSATLDVRPRPTSEISANDFVCEFQTAPIDFAFTGTGNWICNYKINGVAQTQINTALALFPNDYVNASVGRTYEITRLVDANCPAKTSGLASFFINVPIPCSITWNGSASSDWNDGNNWTPNNAAPSNQTSVIIPGGTPNQPVLNNNTPTAPICASFTLLANSSPSIASGFQLTVRGNITGSVNPGSLGGSGKVVLAGTGIQTISNQVRLTNVDFANTSASGVVISPGSTLSIEPTGTATFLANSKLTNSGNFVLASSAAGTGRIATIPTTANITGGVMTIERYLPNSASGTGSWYMMSTPFSGNNFSELADDFKVSGLTSGFGTQGGGIYPVTQPERNTVFAYNEPQNNVRLDTTQKDGWIAPSNGNMAPGAGYRVYVDYYSNNFHKFDTKGSLVRNDFTFPSLTRTVNTACSPATYNCDLGLTGWNLLGNPYPSSIDWDAASGWTMPGNLQAGFWRYNGSLGYGSYVSGLGWTGANPAPANPSVIPSSQGFFVRLATGTSGTMLVKESAKVATNGAYLRTSTSTASKLKINLNKPELNGSYFYSGVVRFMEDATDGFDPMLDFSNLASQNFSFSFPVANAQLMVNSMGALNEQKIVPITTNFMGVSGIYSFSFNDLNTLDAGVEVYLRDKFFNTIESVVENSEISFEVNASTMTMSDRFELVFNPVAITGVKGLGKGQFFGIHPNPSNGNRVTLSVSGVSDQDATVTVIDMVGKVVFTSSMDLSGNKLNEKEFDFRLPAGVYTVKFNSRHNSFMEKMVIR